MNETNSMDEHRAITDTCLLSGDDETDISMKCSPARIEYLNSQFLVFDANG